MYAVRMGGMRNSCGKCSQSVRREDTVDMSLDRDKMVDQCFSAFLPQSKPSNNFSCPKISLFTKRMAGQKHMTEGSALQLLRNYC
jgi:hypothetical protein